VEKISHIVRGNPRVASVDVKSSSAVRPGALAYGRDVGTSTSAPEGEKALSTASKAATLQSQMADRRSSAQDRIVDNMADQFFMSRIRRPEEPIVVQTKAVDEEAAEELNLSGVVPEEKAQPTGFQPRGSYVDVQA
jgi:hypothetical protein